MCVAVPSSLVLQVSGVFINFDTLCSSKVFFSKWIVASRKLKSACEIAVLSVKREKNPQKR